MFHDKLFKPYVVLESIRSITKNNIYLYEYFKFHDCITTYIILNIQCYLIETEDILTVWKVGTLPINVFFLQFGAIVTYNGGMS